MPQSPRRAQPHSRLLTALAVAGGLALCSLPMLAAGAAKSAAPAAASRVAGTARFVDSASSEKPATREKRLKRECRGRPNAGACLGFAS